MALWAMVKESGVENANFAPTWGVRCRGKEENWEHFSLKAGILGMYNEMGLSYCS